jgi:predicted DNA-binding protein (UPF0251 family)
LIVPLPQRRVNSSGSKGLEKSNAFYTTLFGQSPAKIRPRYAKFEVAEPPVNLSLNEVGGATGQNNPVAHFGIQVKSSRAVKQIADRLQEAVRLSEIEELPQHEVADRIGLSVSGAKSRVQRGRAMLREVLDQCCVFQFDRQGNLMDCDPKPDRNVCRDCGDLELPPISKHA